MPIVRTAKDHDWHVFRRDTIQKLKAVGILHFDIEQQQVRFANPHCGDGLKCITALGNDLNPALLRQQESQLIPHQRLIIGDDGARISGIIMRISRKRLSICGNHPIKLMTFETKKWLVTKFCGLVSRRERFPPTLRHPVSNHEKQLRDHPTIPDHRCQHSGQITYEQTHHCCLPDDKELCVTDELMPDY